MTYDCFTFFNELDLLEIRLNTLADVVDRFVITEATRTHRGQPKELLFEKNRKRFAAFADKIIYLVVDDLLPEEEISKDAFHLAWVNENRQRNELARGLKDLQDDDVILVSDLDEIPRPEKVAEAVRLAQLGEIVRFDLDLFVVYANCKDYRTPHWKLGTVAISGRTYRTSKAIDRVQCNRYTVASECQERCLQKVRFLKQSKRIANGGWHMSYLGGAEAIKKKLHAFSHAEASRLENKVDERLKAGLDVRGGRRNTFGVPLDDTFPKYLVANQTKFAHLIFALPDGYLRATRLQRLSATLRGIAYRTVFACLPRRLIDLLAPFYRKLTSR